MFSIVNRPINYCLLVAWGVFFVCAANGALAQNQPTILERQLIQNRVVHTAHPEKLILAIGEAFYDLRFQSVGVNTTLYPAYLESIKNGDDVVDFTGNTIKCYPVNVYDDCGESIKLELSGMKDNKYLLKLVVNGGRDGAGGENFNKQVYRKYYEAISKSLFIEKADLQLDAPTKW